MELLFGLIQNIKNFLNERVLPMYEQSGLSLVMRWIHGVAVGVAFLLKRVLYKIKLQEQNLQSKKKKKEFIYRIPSFLIIFYRLLDILWREMCFYYT